MPNEIYDYNKYMTPDYILKKEDEKKIEEDNSTESEFKLIL